MSIRTIRQLKITNENKDDIQDILDRNVDLKTVLECMVYLKKNPLVYYDGLRDLGYYEMYKLVQHKINDVIRPFVDTKIKISNPEDLYYELRLTDVTKESHLVTEMADFYGETPEEFFSRIIKEKENNSSVCLRYELHFVNKKDAKFINIFETLLDEIKESINLFLQNYHHRFEKEVMKIRGYKNIEMKTSIFDDTVEIELYLPFCVFNCE